MGARRYGNTNQDDKVKTPTKRATNPARIWDATNGSRNRPSSRTIPGDERIRPVTPRSVRLNRPVIEQPNECRVESGETGTPGNQKL